MITPLDLNKNGVIKDIQPALLGSAWSHGLNVHFDEGNARSAHAWVPVSSTEEDPYAVWSIQRPTYTVVVYAGIENMFALTGQVSTDITRQSAPYSGGSLQRWTATSFNGLVVFNNTLDPPQAWSPVDPSVRLVDLPNWPSGAVANVVRAFKNYLVALGVSGEERLVKWSHSAAVGQLPTSWDEADATKEAGEVILGGSSDALVDCLPLGGINVIYGQSSINLMSPAPLPFVFGFSEVSRQAGLLSVDCVTEFLGQHFVLSSDDVIVFSGSGIRSVAEGKIRKWLFREMDSQNYKLSRVVKNQRAREIWILFPESGTSLLTKAAVWNWAYDTWTIVDVPGLRGAAEQLFVVSGAEGIWEGDPSTWDDASGTWDGDTRVGSAFSGWFIGALPGLESSIVAYDSSTVMESAAVIERKGLASEWGPGWRKLCLGVWPVIEGENGQKFSISVGSHDTPDGEVAWQPEKTWTVGEPKVDFYVEGRYLAIRLKSMAPWGRWKILGIEIDLARTGRL